MGRGAGGSGGHAASGGERCGERVRGREDVRVRGKHGAEVGERSEGAAARERVEEGVPGGDVADCVGDVGEHGEGGVEEGPREGAVEGDEGVGDGRVGGGVGLDRPCVEGLAVAGAGGCAAEVLDELRVRHAPCGRRPACHGVAWAGGGGSREISTYVLIVAKSSILIHLLKTCKWAFPSRIIHLWVSMKRTCVNVFITF
jgi:hypothetical protein